jgi:hypothetical protein
MQQSLKPGFSCRSTLLPLLIGLIFCSCTYPSARYHPQFINYRHAMGALLVLPPEIRIFEQLSDGNRLFQDIQSQEAQRRAQAAIVRQLMKRHFTVRAASPQLMQKLEYRSVTALFRSVNLSIQLHTYGPQPFPAKVDAFEYSVGSVADILAANGADGLVLSIGYQSGSDQPGSDWFSIAVVEPEGRIIWYNLLNGPQRFDLQSEAGVSSVVDSAMADFWEHGS